MNSDDAEAEADEKLVPFLPYFLEYSLMQEYKQLQRNIPMGIYVVPSLKNSFTWQGVIFVRDGHYFDGIFRFNIYIPDDYPGIKVPHVQFINRIFHPSISYETGFVKLDVDFPQWNEKYHIWHIIGHLKNLLEFDLSDCASSEAPRNMLAAELFQKDKNGAFMQRVRECVGESVENIYKTPSEILKNSYMSTERTQEHNDKMKLLAEEGGITFQKWKESVHAASLRAILNRGGGDSQGQGAHQTPKVAGSMGSKS